ncbi:MAG: hypothetical protein KIT11_06500 [Fimbriimonadaceae bacterium]|nr:hypothetical protein [Fimbriimonadaceae bacterium]QYK56007.1 MAG: hypothetical protein KF733_00690 [Fimbriimonadaceae bacterium]
MDWSWVERNWDSLRHDVVERWNAVTSEDLTSIAGNRNRFVEMLQHRYEMGRQAAEAAADDWARRMRDPRKRQAALTVGGALLLIGAAFAGYMLFQNMCRRRELEHRESRLDEEVASTMDASDPIARY